MLHTACRWGQERLYDSKAEVLVSLPVTQTLLKCPPRHKACTFLSLVGTDFIRVHLHDTGVTGIVNTQKASAILL